jgi:hypothetical protein
MGGIVCVIEKFPAIGIPLLFLTVPVWITAIIHSPSIFNKGIGE